MKKILLTIAISAALSGTVYAAPGDAVPNTFSNGTPANADQVNANFTEVTNQISTLAEGAIQGLQGEQGIQGEQGLQGIQGVPGLQGIQGDRGLQGEQGLPGQQGLQGLQGEQGLTGQQGIQGERGLQGEQGLPGQQGLQGLQGEQGLPGQQGIQGEQGLAGTNGTNGINGNDGVGITSIVNDGSGNLTINLSDNSSSVHTIPTVTTYSFRDYTQAYTTKTFDVTDSRGKYVTEVRTFDRSVSGQVSYLRDRIKADTNRFKLNTVVLDTSGTELKMIGFKSHNPVTEAVATDMTIAPGLVARTESMQIGKTFGSDVKVTVNDLITPAVTTAYTQQRAVLLATNQTVLVPAGEFTGCIKLSYHRSGNALGETFDRTTTHCPSVGMVKQVHSRVFYDSVTPGIKTHTTVTELASCDAGACIQ